MRRGLAVASAADALSGVVVLIFVLVLVGVRRLGSGDLTSASRLPDFRPPRTPYLIGTDLFRARVGFLHVRVERRYR